MVMQKEDLQKLPEFERALTLAGIKHAGQIDKGGEPYVMHVIRVMMKLDEEKTRVAALLHDLMEDTDIDENDLLELGFDEDIVGIVKLLTRNPKEDYMDYIRNLAKDKRAILIKLSDLTDNQNRTRIKGALSRVDLERLEKYHRAEEYLLSILHKI